MATATEKAHWVGWYFESKSITTVQRKFRNMFKENPSSRNSILVWHEKFLETGSVLDKERSGGPRRSDETVQGIREAFARSPTQSISRTSRELGVARSTVHDVLRKRLSFHPYKVLLLLALNPGVLNRRFNFAIDMLERADADFLLKIIFIDEATFHLSSTVNS
ncbi:unnamed protein product [Larinioides sclopetarius]|uniref:DUF4817 domain-containing protein n=1 Tax=Larinioides sclopetarius TaxID=280406 RepID=A0AAV2BIA2_9ARAC